MTSGFTPSYRSCRHVPEHAGHADTYPPFHAQRQTPPVGGWSGHEGYEAPPWWADAEINLEPRSCYWCGRPAVGVLLGELDEPNRHFCTAHDGMWRTDVVADVEVSGANEEKEESTMPKYNVTEPSFNLPDPGWYDAYLSKVVEEQVVRDGEAVDVLVWNFELNGGDTIVRTFSSTSFSKRSKAYGWASALLEIDDEVDTDDLADLPCRVKIIHKPSRQDPERIFANVDEVRAPAPVAKADKPKRREAPQPVPVGAADEDEAPF